MTIKAIETRYAGCDFRSRLEARWAVLFDELGIEWLYEPERFENTELKSKYLPDFYLPEVHGGTYFEIKGDWPTVDYEWRVSSTVPEDHVVVFAVGDVAPSDLYRLVSTEKHTCSELREYVPIPRSGPERCHERCSPVDIINWDYLWNYYGRLDEAVSEARSARFGHYERILDPDDFFR